MRVFARSGQRAAALAQYERCRKVLADELGIEPAAETTALYECIRTEPLELAVGAHARSASAHSPYLALPGPTCPRRRTR